MEDVYERSPAGTWVAVEKIRQNLEVACHALRMCIMSAHRKIEDKGTE